ncbi:hypothetical protein BCV73_30765 [Paenibacillus sp. SSG-1]|nr:hypothetical protein BCV73_30765 [Paenibacillus sp. SSG-1]
MEAASVARFENPSSKADKMPPLLFNGQGTAAFLPYDEAVIQRCQMFGSRWITGRPADWPQPGRFRPASC